MSAWTMHDQLFSLLVFIVFTSQTVIQGAFADEDDYCDSAVTNSGGLTVFCGMVCVYMVTNWLSLQKRE